GELLADSGWSYDRTAYVEWQSYGPIAGGGEAVCGCDGSGEGEPGDRVGADERVGKRDGVGIELFAGKWNMGTMRIERQCDGDSECSGGCYGSSERAGADILVDFWTVCASDAEWGDRRPVGESGGESEHCAAGEYTDRHKQFQRDPIRDGVRQLEFDRVQHHGKSGNSDADAVSSGDRYQRAGNVFRLHRAGGNDGDSAGHGRDVQQRGGFGNDHFQCDKYLYQRHNQQRLFGSSGSHQ